MPTLLERLRAALAPEYDVEYELATGGMGTVFRGRDPGLDRAVAIKTVRPELWTESTAERFRREAQILATFDHPNIVHVHQVGERQGLSFYVMRFLEGQTLAQRLEDGSLPLQQAVDLSYDMLDALTITHARGVVHRDIKPSNIFIENGRGVLTDFGIAKRRKDRSEEGTAAGHVLGTIDYMPPEQAAGGEVTPRTDLYALAMVIYEAITGRHVHAPGAPRWRRLPFGVARVLRKALNEDPAQRWPDAPAFKRALSAAMRRHSYTVPVAATVGVVALGTLTLYILCLWPFRCPTPVYDLVVAPFTGVADPGVRSKLAYFTRDMLERFPRIHVTSDSVPIHRGVLYRLDGRVTQRDSLEVFVQLLDSMGQPVHNAIFRRSLSGQFDLADDIAFWVISHLHPELKEKYVPDSTLRGRKVAALDEFLRGEAAFDDDAWSEAERHFQEALRLDTNFARAAWRLANAQNWRRITPTVDLRALLQRKWRYLKPLDSLLIAAQIAPQGPARYRLYEQALTHDPDDAYARLLYGAELMHRGPLAGVPLDSAVVVLGESAAQDPTLTPPQDQLVWALIFLGRRDEARAALDRMERTKRPDPGADIDTRAALPVAFVARFEPARLPELLKNTPQGVQQDIGRILRLSLGFDSPEAERFLGQQATGRPERSARAAGHEAQGLALFATGKRDSALAQFDSAAVLFGTATAALEALEWRVVPAALGVSAPSTGDAARAHTQLAAIAVANAPTAARAAWALAVDAYARGDTADARSWRARLRTRAGGDEAIGRLDTLLAALELGARSHFAAAFARSGALLPYDESDLLGDPFVRTVLHVRRAEWSESLGDPAAADRDWLWYENSDFEGWLTGEVDAVEIDWAFSTWARWRRARDAVAAGDKARACKYLTRVAELWRAADQSAPNVRDALALQGKCPP